MASNTITDNSTNVSSTNTTTTSDEIDPNLIIGLVDKIYLTYLIVVVVSFAVLIPFVASILTKIIKPINCFVRSYNRILTSMISDSIYELQFLQTIACFSFLNTEFLIEAKHTFLTFRKFAFLDYIDHLTYSDEKAKGLPAPIQPYFTNGFFDNSKTFIILFVFGFVVVFLIAVKEVLELIFTKKKDDVVITDMNKGNNKTEIKVEQNMQDNNQKENSKEVIYENLRDQKFKKCSLPATKQYFLFNYFIRIYQVTMTKLTLVCLIVISNRNLPTSNKIDVLIAYIVLISWLILLPIGMFTYLRKKAIDLMSPDMIVKYGTLYLTYRGYSKDVYAFLIQLKFALLPIICSYLWNFPQIQIIMLVIMYLFNILFITIYMPFFKINKVFAEAISEGVLMGFCIVILVIELVPSLKTSAIPRYILMLLILLVLVIRSYRIIYDTVYRIKNLRKIKQPKLYAIDVPYELKGEDHIEIEKQKKKDKKMMKYNNYEKNLRGTTTKVFTNIKSAGTMADQSNNNKNEEKQNDKTQLSNNMSHNSHRRLLSKERENSIVKDDKIKFDSRVAEEDFKKAPINYTNDRKNFDSNDDNIEINVENFNKKNSNIISPNKESILKKKTTNPITRIMTKKTIVSKNDPNMFKEDIQIEMKKSFPKNNELSINRVGTLENHSIKIKKANTKDSDANINDKKMEEYTLVNYLNGSNIMNMKSYVDTLEIEEKYDGEFDNMSNNFNNNTILSGKNSFDNTSKKKNFDVISKISKTGSNQSSSDGGLFPNLFPKNPKKFSNLEMIKEEINRTQSRDFYNSRKETEK